MPVTRTQLRQALGVVTIAGQASATRTDTQAGRHLGIRSSVVGRQRVKSGVLSEREAAVTLAKVLFAPDANGVATRTDSYVCEQMALQGLCRSPSGARQLRVRAGIKLCKRAVGYGAALKEFRLSKELSQREIGRRFGVGKTAVSQWERGAPMPAVVVQMFGLSRSEVSQ